MKIENRGEFPLADFGPAIYIWDMENDTRQFVIAVDFENSAEDWWDAIRDHGGGCFAEAIEALDANGSITVSAEQKDQLLAHFRRFPGWLEGPSYARYPVTIRRAE